MPTPPRHFSEELDALLDGRLDAAQRAEVETHLTTCEDCRRVFDTLRWTKQFAATRFAAPEAPADLQAKILRSLRADTVADVVPTKSIVPLPAPTQRAWNLRHTLALAATLVLAALLAGVLYFARPALPSQVAQDFRAYHSKKLPLNLETADLKQMEEYFAANGVPFTARVFDLGMMQYQLVGGGVHQLDRRTSALFVYRGPAGEELLCQMFPGQVAKLPAGAERRVNKGIEFFIYRKDGTTTVFWQEGTIVCALASDIASENVVQLAFAKAMIP